MNQSALLLGCLGKIAIDGTAYTAPAGGTVSRTNCPPNDAATATASIWADLGIVESCQEKTDSTKIEIYRPSPGHLELDDELETKLKRTLTLKISECSNVMWLLLRRALKPTSPLTGAIGQHVPLSVAGVKAWVKFQRYNQAGDALVDAEQVFAKVSITNAVEYGNEKQIQFDLEIKQLWSPLNTATAS